MLFLTSEPTPIVVLFPIETPVKIAESPPIHSFYPTFSYHVCDYKKWESHIFKDYYVFATPTIYLLNADRKIILRPSSFKQIGAWVDWVLVQGNK